jgi:hypothetical protein
MCWIRCLWSPDAADSFLDHGMVTVTEDLKLGNHSNQTTSTCKRQRGRHIRVEGRPITFRPAGSPGLQSIAYQGQEQDDYVEAALVIDRLSTELRPCGMSIQSALPQPRATMKSESESCYRSERGDQHCATCGSGNHTSASWRSKESRTSHDRRSHRAGKIFTSVNPSQQAARHRCHFLVAHSTEHHSGDGRAYATRCRQAVDMNATPCRRSALQPTTRFVVSVWCRRHANTLHTMHYLCT